MTPSSTPSSSSTPPSPAPLEDRALAVFAFAAYHALESGQRVRKVVRADGAGHHADAEAVAALEKAGLVRAEADSIGFTQDGERVLETVLDALRRAMPDGISAAPSP